MPNNWEMILANLVILVPLLLLVVTASHLILFRAGQPKPHSSKVADEQDEETEEP